MFRVSTLAEKVENAGKTGKCSFLQNLAQKAGKP